ncbi:hypothetical protein T265_02218 [Opisthorchis viverrini]|uniref:U6 snRNA phosphodiesterase 1 n=1 Tax=Opisthorchis viverrini TaxID=6198 RepID=A0A075A7E2_OPIVI|nr:hypothetical protein T265_02218 [Opisthorchis viverrini]KER31580.1 hypothetical protein T265_02218 [Opisthorchis viverrini]
MSLPRPSLFLLLNNVLHMPSHRLPKRVLFSMPNSDWQKQRGWRPRDPYCAWLETLLNIAANRYISENTEKLELPTFFQGLEADSIRFEAHEDDPTMHQLRRRSFAHEVGQWASFLKQFVSALHLSEHPLWQCLHSVDDVHVSLSKTWPLRYHWIDSLADKLRNTFQNLSRYVVTIVPLIFIRFDIRFSGLELFINGERSRSFIGLILSRESSEHLKPIVASVDQCVHAFCGPRYYKVGTALILGPKLSEGVRWSKWLQREFTDRKVRGSNPTSVSRLFLSRLGQPGSIPALVPPWGGMVARHRKDATAERFET